jgi:hypothetical protein
VKIIKKADKWLLYAIMAAVSPFATWRIYDWYMRAIADLWDKLQWGDVSRICSGILLAMTVVIFFAAWVIERCES